MLQRFDACRTRSQKWTHSDETQVKIKFIHLHVDKSYCYYVTYELKSVCDAHLPSRVVHLQKSLDDQRELILDDV